MFWLQKKSKKVCFARLLGPFQIHTLQAAAGPGSRPFRHPSGLPRSRSRGAGTTGEMGFGSRELVLFAQDLFKWCFYLVAYGFVCGLFEFIVWFFMFLFFFSILRNPVLRVIGFLCQVVDRESICRASPWAGKLWRLGRPLSARATWGSLWWSSRGPSLDICRKIMKDPEVFRLYPSQRKRFFSGVCLRSWKITHRFEGGSKKRYQNFFWAKPISHLQFLRVRGLEDWVASETTGFFEWFLIIWGFANTGWCFHVVTSSRPTPSKALNHQLAKDLKRTFQGILSLGLCQKSHNVS